MSDMEAAERLDDKQLEFMGACFGLAAVAGQLPTDAWDTIKVIIESHKATNKALDAAKAAVWREAARMALEKSVRGQPVNADYDFGYEEACRSLETDCSLLACLEEKGHGTNQVDTGTSGHD